MCSLLKEALSEADFIRNDLNYTHAHYYIRCLESEDDILVELLQQVLGFPSVGGGHVHMLQLLLLLLLDHYLFLVEHLLQSVEVFLRLFVQLLINVPVYLLELWNNDVL